MNVKVGHFLQGTDYDKFDAPFFNISPNEAKVRLGSSTKFEWLLIYVGDRPKSADALGRSLRSSRER